MVVAGVDAGEAQSRSEKPAYRRPSRVEPCEAENDRPARGDVRARKAAARHRSPVEDRFDDGNEDSTLQGSQRRHERPVLPGTARGKKRIPYEAEEESGHDRGDGDLKSGTRMRAGAEPGEDHPAAHDEVVREVERVHQLVLKKAGGRIQENRR